jgi:hypothetical protein
VCGERTALLRFNGAANAFFKVARADQRGRDAMRPAKAGKQVVAVSPERSEPRGVTVRERLGEQCPDCYRAFFWRDAILDLFVTKCNQSSAKMGTNFTSIGRFFESKR